MTNYRKFWHNICARRVRYDWQFGGKKSFSLKNKNSYLYISILQRLQKGYLENPEQNHYLEEMIVADMKSSKLYAEPLLWLKRALELINYFFTNILDDKTCQESLIEHLKAAYTKTLQPYHGWLVQGAFNVNS